MNKESENENISDLMNNVLKSIILLNKEIESHFDMSAARILTLLAFTEKKTMQMSELSEAMSLTTSTSTRMIDGLVKEDLVQRRHDQFDRRLVVVGLGITAVLAIQNYRNAKSRNLDPESKLFNQKGSIDNSTLDSFFKAIEDLIFNPIHLI